jgi:hypothetical protein
MPKPAFYGQRQCCIHSRPEGERCPSASAWRRPCCTALLKAHALPRQTDRQTDTVGTSGTFAAASGAGCKRWVGSDRQTPGWDSGYLLLPPVPAANTEWDRDRQAPLDPRHRVGSSPGERPCAPFLIRAFPQPGAGSRAMTLPWPAQQQSTRRCWCPRQCLSCSAPARRGPCCPWLCCTSAQLTRPSTACALTTLRSSSDADLGAVLKGATLEACKYASVMPAGAVGFYCGKTSY